MITWCVAAVSAKWFLGLNTNIAALLAAVLVVTGPTVVGPLIRHIRPTGKSGSVLRWEGIVIDPIGALLAVLVFEAVESGASIAPSAQMLSTVAIMFREAAITMCCGLAVGTVAAGILILILSRFWVPDYLHVPLTLTTAIVALIMSNQIVHESGLFTVTIMGIVLANQQKAAVRPIVEFKENLTVILVGMLFIVLSAHRDRDPSPNQARRDIFHPRTRTGRPPAGGFREFHPLRPHLDERTFIAWMAPARHCRRIGCLGLFTAPAATKCPPGPGARALCLSCHRRHRRHLRPDRRLDRQASRPACAGNAGFLIIGADLAGREIARTLIDEGIEILLVDTSPAKIREARLAGIPALSANALSAQVEERIELSGIGRLLAMTSNQEVNALAVLHYAKLFGRSATYQLPDPKHAEPILAKQKTHHELTGRLLFDPAMNFEELEDRLERGENSKNQTHRRIHVRSLSSRARRQRRPPLHHRRNRRTYPRHPRRRRRSPCRPEHHRPDRARQNASHFERLIFPAIRVAIFREPNRSDCTPSFSPAPAPPRVSHAKAPDIPPAPSAALAVGINLLRNAGELSIFARERNSDSVGPGQSAVT